jgi:hypothetical protein
LDKFEVIVAICSGFGAIIAFITALSIFMKNIKKKIFSSLRIEDIDTIKKAVETLTDNSTRQNEIITTQNEQISKTKIILDMLIETDIISLQAEILNIYNRYQDKKQIPISDFEFVTGAYDCYKRLGGNHFIDSIYEKIGEWEIS